MEKRYCCPECFDDRGLRDDIFPTLNPAKGRCSFCGTDDVLLVEPNQLSPWFELLVNVYEPRENGKSLVEWMKEDWELFTHHTMDLAHAKELLGEILDNGDCAATIKVRFSVNQDETRRRGSDEGRA